MENDIPEKYIIGRKYHCSWAKSRGCVWKLISINEDVAILETPKTKKRITTQLSSLREINKYIKYEASR